VEGSTPIQAPAKESALSSPGDHVGSAGLIDTKDSDDINFCGYREQIIKVSLSFLTVPLIANIH
jgi:hypothetical protein